MMLYFIDESQFVERIVHVLPDPSNNLNILLVNIFDVILLE